MKIKFTDQLINNRMEFYYFDNLLFCIYHDKVYSLNWWGRVAKMREEICLAGKMPPRYWQSRYKDSSLIRCGIKVDIKQITLPQIWQERQTQEIAFLTGKFPISKRYGLREWSERSF